MLWLRQSEAPSARLLGSGTHYIASTTNNLVPLSVPYEGMSTRAPGRPLDALRHQPCAAALGAPGRCLFQNAWDWEGWLGGLAGRIEAKIVLLY